MAAPGTTSASSRPRPADAQLLHRPDVGAVRHLRRRQRVPAAVARQERDPLAADLADRDRRRRLGRTASRPRSPRRRPGTSRSPEPPKTPISACIGLLGLVGRGLLGGRFLILLGLLGLLGDGLFGRGSRRRGPRAPRRPALPAPAPPRGRLAAPAAPRPAPARPALDRRRRVRELQVGDHLVEVARRMRWIEPSSTGPQRAQASIPSRACGEVAIGRRQPAIGQRRHGVQRLQQQIGDPRTWPSAASSSTPPP